MRVRAHLRVCAHLHPRATSRPQACLRSMLPAPPPADLGGPRPAQSPLCLGVGSVVPAAPQQAWPCSHHRLLAALASQAPQGAPEGRDPQHPPATRVQIPGVLLAWAPPRQHIWGHSWVPPQPPILASCEGGAQRALGGVIRVQWGSRSPPSQDTGGFGVIWGGRSPRGQIRGILGMPQNGARWLAEANLAGYRVLGCHRVLEVRYRVLQGAGGQPRWTQGAGVTWGDNC